MLVRNLSKYAQQQSSTAMTIAQGFVSSVQYKNFKNDDAKRLVNYLISYAKPHYGFSGKLFAQLYDVFPQWAVNRVTDFVNMHNFTGHIATRKAYISQSVDDEIAAGATQVLVIGGGFDAMALMKHKQYPNVQFFEIDRGGHRYMKLDALEVLRTGTYPTQDLSVLAEGLQHYAKIDPNMHFVEADMSLADWEERLKAEGFDPAKKTVCVAEGFTMYLPEKAVKEWLQRLNTLVPNSTLMLSFIEPEEVGTKVVSEGFGKMWLGKSGEAFKARVAKAAVPAFMFENGYSTQEQFPSVAIQKTFGISDKEIADNARINPCEHYFKVTPKQPGDVLKTEAEIPVASIRATLVNPLTDSEKYENAKSEAMTYGAKLGGALGLGIGSGAVVGLALAEAQPDVSVASSLIKFGLLGAASCAAIGAGISLGKTVTQHKLAKPEEAAEENLASANRMRK